MRLLIRCAAGMYPAQWRARYGAELDALVDDAGAGWPEFVDICRGAIKMQILRGSAWQFAAICGVLGLVAAGVFALRSPNQYKSQAVLRMAAGSEDEEIDRLNKAEQTVLSRSSLAALIQQLDLYKKERQTLPLEDIVQNMRNQAIQIRMLARPNSVSRNLAFALTFDDEDPRRAQGVVSALTMQFITAMKDSAPLEVLDSASLPQVAFAPNRPALLALGLALGLAAGVLLLGVRRWPVVPLVGLGVALLALPASYLIPSQYQSQAVLRAKGDIGPAVNDAVRSPQFLESLVRQYSLYPGENGVEKMQSSLKVHALHPVSPSTRNVLLLSFDYTDRDKATHVLRDVIAKIGAGPAGAQIEILDPPSLPETAFTPNRLAIVLGALLVGLLLGAALAMVRRQRTLSPAH
jgi:hypothetical protein